MRLSKSKSYKLTVFTTCLYTILCFTLESGAVSAGVARFLWNKPFVNEQQYDTPAEIQAVLRHLFSAWQQCSLASAGLFLVSLFIILVVIIFLSTLGSGGCWQLCWNAVVSQL